MIQKCIQNEFMKKMFVNLIIPEANREIETHLKKKIKETLEEIIPIKSMALF